MIQKRACYCFTPKKAILTHNRKKSAPVSGIFLRGVVLTPDIPRASMDDQSRLNRCPRIRRRKRLSVLHVFLCLVICIVRNKQ